MAKTKYYIQLTEEEKQRLYIIIDEGTESERTILRAKVLLMSDVSYGMKLSIPKVAERLGTTHTTVQTVRTEYALSGLDAAVFRKKRADNIETRRLNSKVREQIVQLSKEEPPEGHKRWSLRLLCQKAVERGITDHISVGTMIVVMNEAGIKLKE